MKNTKKILLIAFVALLATTNAHAYRWIFTNWTGSAIILQVELLGSSNPYFVYVAPERTADFNWEVGNPRAGHCLGAIKYLEIKKPTRDPLLTKLMYNKVIVNDKVVDNNRMLEFCNSFGKIYERQIANLRFMPDDLFNKTVANLKKAAGTDFGAKIVGWFADKIKESSCRNRDIAVARDDSGAIGFYTLAN